MDITRLKQPRCFLVYALAPEGLSPGEANRAFNAFLADPNLPPPIFHDHFIGDPGGLAIFYAADEGERRALAASDHLKAWRVELRPLVYARSPAGFDEQTSFTLRAYRGMNWEQLRREDRPVYGEPEREIETGEEQDL